MAKGKEKTMMNEKQISDADKNIDGLADRGAQIISDLRTTAHELAKELHAALNRIAELEARKGLDVEEFKVKLRRYEHTVDGVHHLLSSDVYRLLDELSGAKPKPAEWDGRPPEGAEHGNWFWLLTPVGGRLPARWCEGGLWLVGGGHKYPSDLTEWRLDGPCK